MLFIRSSCIQHPPRKIPFPANHPLPMTMRFLPALRPMTMRFLPALRPRLLITLGALTCLLVPGHGAQVEPVGGEGTPSPRKSSFLA